jgi:hypothetical protein
VNKEIRIWKKLISSENKIKSIVTTAGSDRRERVTRKRRAELSGVSSVFCLGRDWI